MTNYQTNQRGQSMVEYTVILIALTTALYTITSSGDRGKLIGSDKHQPDSLLQAMHQHYTQQSYALRLSQLPERHSQQDLAQYYDALNKYDALAPQLNNWAASVNQLNGKVMSANQNIKNVRSQIDQAKNLKRKLENNIPKLPGF